MMYADLTKAFDRICHEILIDKLYKWGLSDTLLDFLVLIFTNDG